MAGYICRLASPAAAWRGLRGMSPRPPSRARSRKRVSRFAAPSIAAPRRSAPRICAIAPLSCPKAPPLLSHVVLCPPPKAGDRRQSGRGGAAQPRRVAGAAVGADDGAHRAAGARRRLAGGQHQLHLRVYPGLQQLLLGSLQPPSLRHRLHSNDVLRKQPGEPGRGPETTSGSAYRSETEVSCFWRGE